MEGSYNFVPAETHCKSLESKDTQDLLLKWYSPLTVGA